MSIREIAVSIREWLFKRAWGIILGLSAIVSLVSGWDGFIKKFGEAQRDATPASAAFISWITSVISLPIWLLFILLIFAMLGVWSLISKYLFKVENPTATSIEPRITIDSLIIYEAKWGAFDQWIDVTNILKQSIDNNRLQFDVHIDNLGDPYKGAGKDLKITWKWHGKTHRETYAENDIIQIPN